MGIIQKQTITGTIFSYAGVVIGFITMALIFPKYLTTEQIGLLSIFLSYSYIFAQLATLGTGRVTVVYYPFFKNKEKSHHGFFFWIVLVSSIGLILSLIGFFIIKPWLVQNTSETSKLFADNINYLIPLIVISMVFLLFDSFYKSLLNAVIGIILKEFLQRLLILLFITLLIFKYISFDQYIPLYILAIGIPAIVLMIRVLRHPEFTLKPCRSELLKVYRNRLLSIGLYGIMIGFSGMVILNIDRIMVERMLGLGQTGIYTTMAYFATLIIIPSRALLKISDPVIAQAWKNMDMTVLQNNYYRSSLNQFLIGILLLIGIWGNIDNINRILPPVFAEGNLVVLFIGFAFLTDMASGTSTYILANSKYFKYQTYFILLLVLFIIITNLLLIPVWGITGAAVATFISKLLNSYMRFQLLYNKFRLQPYDRKYLYIIGISLIAYASGYFLPEIVNLYLDIILRSAIIGGMFISLAVLLKISPEVNERLNHLVRLLGRKR